MHRVASSAPKPLTLRLQRLANENRRARAVLARLSATMRQGPHPIASGPAKGMRMDVAGSRPSYLLGTAELDVVQVLVNHVRPGDTVFDLGANVGYFTLIAAALTGPTGKVVAYEPIPANAEVLRRNVELNRLANVEVVEAAVSDRDGTAEINVDSSDQKASFAIPRDSGSLTVRTVTLDSEVARVGAPAIVKCDIEGAEHEAFANARTALASRPAILCEVHRLPNGDGDEHFESILLECGYRVRWLERGDWISHIVATAP
jgi:FkbM family methyltransferase